MQAKKHNSGHAVDQDLPAAFIACLD